ncbi:MAG: hypothetical protein JRH13_11555 [Deltaproteobacteria bacterium]|nr:hypothetical protein [Deltaproteobacteria bacterium]MBW2304628.1 hypothetical protein [Deltaproteobacteria bacterium]
MHILKIGRVMRKPMAIIASYFEGEDYGLLGPQMAATIIEDHTPFECMVLALTRGDDRNLIKKGLSDYFGKERPIVGFSTLSGREDLFLLARELKDEGAFTILAGPQADVDFLGETGWRDHPHRFKGLADHFTLAIQGPAEQAVPLLNRIESGDWRNIRGLLSLCKNGEVFRNPKASWNETFLGKVRWDNLYRVGPGGFFRHRVQLGQVLQHIGCPHASRPRRISVAYPSYLQPGKRKKINLVFRGCSFCDVAVDKGFRGALSLETVLSQIRCLPETEEKRKIPFELINENALPGLPRLLGECEKRGILLSRINLTLRADWFLLGEKHLREALGMARRQRVRILLSSVGFESFHDGILQNLNKGVTVETNLKAIRLMRRLKKEFPFQWAYATREGALHGFIHPTPWDTPETEAGIREIIACHGLSADILPPHSVPLIIHHASGLADWIREIERREQVRFKRYVSVIGWWEEALLPPGEDQGPKGNCDLHVIPA